MFYSYLLIITSILVYCMETVNFNGDLSFPHTQHHSLIFSIMKIIKIPENLSSTAWFILFFDKYSNQVLEY